MVYIRLLAIVDKACSPNMPQIFDALNRVGNDYETATSGKVGVEYIKIEKDLASVPWENYGNGWGFNRSWVAAEAKQIRTLYEDSIDCLVYFADKSNWRQDAGAAGWNLGAFYSGYQVQLVQVTGENVEWLTNIIRMELHHSLNDWYYMQYGRRIESLFGVADYDRYISHFNDYGAGPYPQFNERDWTYRSSLSVLTPYLEEIFGKRKILGLLQQVIRLYRAIIIKLGRRPVAIQEHDLSTGHDADHGAG
jgi:hypothetical protein